jgi:hypothetical protein
LLAGKVFQGPDQRLAEWVAHTCRRESQQHEQQTTNKSIKCSNQAAWLALIHSHKDGFERCGFGTGRRRVDGLHGLGRLSGSGSGSQHALVLRKLLLSSLVHLQSAKWDGRSQGSAKQDIGNAWMLWATVTRDAHRGVVREHGSIVRRRLLGRRVTDDGWILVST